MSYQTLAVEQKEGVGIVTLFGPTNDPARVCRLGDELTEACAAIAWDEAIWVVLITGTGDNPFSIETVCAEGQSGPGNSIVDSVSKLSQPVIIALGGDVLGAGLELALACDIRMAAEGCRFGLPQIQSSMIPAEGGTQRLPRIIGKGKALEMILTGAAIDSAEAHRVGLVSKVVSFDQLMRVSTQAAEEMAAKAPLALQYIKEAVNGGMDVTLEQGLRMEADLYLLLHTTADREKGIRAFREKKIPVFEGK
jgi:enoyl-CoA hydratase/carnithine racemase